jgi:hypothetical protein
LQPFTNSTRGFDRLWGEVTTAKLTPGKLGILKNNMEVERLSVPTDHVCSSSNSSEVE